MKNRSRTLNPHHCGGTLWLVSWLGALSLVAAITGSAAEISDPVELIKQQTHELFQAVNRDSDEISADPGVARALVREYLMLHVDLERTSRWVLGKHWREASDDQKKRFIDEFRTLLIRTYASAVTEFAKADIIYLPLKGDASSNDVTVRSLVPKDDGQPVDIAYRMFKGVEGWKVYDVTVGGVSLVTTYRSSFAAEVRKGGLDGLIDRLAEKNRGTVDQTSSS